MKYFSLWIRHFDSFTCCSHNSISNRGNLEQCSWPEADSNARGLGTCPLPTRSGAPWGPREGQLLFRLQEPGRRRERGGQEEPGCVTVVSKAGCGSGTLPDGDAQGRLAGGSRGVLRLVALGAGLVAAGRSPLGLWSEGSLHGPRGHCGPPAPSAAPGELLCCPSVRLCPLRQRHRPLCCHLPALSPQSAPDCHPDTAPPHQQPCSKRPPVHKLIVKEKSEQLL